MQTTFQEVDLNIIRYAMVWEDAAVIQKALRTDSCNKVAMISSAGCNVLATALSGVKEVHAIDINPVQNLLLRFKIYLYRENDWQMMADLLLLNGKEKLVEACKVLRKSLPPNFQILLPAIQENGLHACGRLEKYIIRFIEEYPNLKPMIERLLLSSSTLERESAIKEVVQSQIFRESFCAYYTAANLSKGRDPKLFQYTDAEAGELFYQRFIDYLQRWEKDWPFVLRFFFQGMNADIAPYLPAPYRKENFEKMKKAVDKIQIVHSEMVEYLCSGAAPRYDGIVLSNIFEYCSHEEFQSAIANILSQQQKARILFWNLLNVQEYQHHLLTDESLKYSQQESCFYFHNLQLHSHES